MKRSRVNELRVVDPASHCIRYTPISISYAKNSMFKKIMLFPTP